MSKHEVKVVALPAIEPHPNADTLGLVEIDGCTVVVKRDQWREGDLAVFVEPDYVVPTEHPAFAFLGANGRIKTRRFRGVYSQGLLVPVSEIEGDLERADNLLVKPGDDVMELLGITRYEPEARGPASYVGGAKEAYVPPGVLADIPVYGLENLRKCKGAFEDGERVIVTEKIHGCNARYTFRDGKMWLGSRTRWVEDDGINVWSLALRACPWIEEQCLSVPGAVAYGEVYGKVQKLGYGLGDGVSFRVFDLRFPSGLLHLTNTGFCAASIVFNGENCGHGFEAVPVIYDGPYSYAKMLELAEGKTTLGGGHIREGVVVKPAAERKYAGSRCAFKVVSNAYLEKDY